MTALVQAVLAASLSIQILAKYELSAVEVLQDGRWVEIRAPLNETLTLREPAIRIPGKGERSYPGSVVISSRGGILSFINEVEEDDYLEGVLAGEAESVSLESLRALAIAARSMIPYLEGRHDGRRLCDLTHCQVYVGKTESSVIAEAVRRTRGRVLFFRGKPAVAPYHSTCGGMTTSPNGFFETDAEYLRPVRDDGLCSASPHYRWEVSLDGEEIRAVLGLGTSPDELKVETVDSTGRARWISADGRRLNGAEFYRRAGAVLGWNVIKSTWFDITVRKGRFRFRGRGLGHGVGLCQWGAEAMAKQGKTAEEILTFYFPGTSIGTAATAKEGRQSWTPSSALGSTRIRKAKLTSMK
jgi:stage II sporulation protein D